MDEELIIHTDSYEFDDRIYSPAVLVYFYDHRDNNCRGFEYVIEEVARHYEETLTVLAVDIEQSPDIAYRYLVENLPFVIMFRDGEPIGDLEGANLPEVYFDLIEAFI